MIRTSLIVTALIFLVGTVGCNSQASKESQFVAGIPSEHYLVGGGFSIYYAAPTNGTAYVVDKTSGKYLMTQSLIIGDPIELSLDPSNEEEKAQLESLGITMSEMDLVLYFVPNTDPALKK